MARNVEDIAWDYLVICSEIPNIGEDNKLNYFLGGSVTTLALIGAEEIQDIFVDEDGEVSGYGDTHIISDESNEILKRFRRKAGDVDVFQVGGGRQEFLHQQLTKPLPSDISDLFSKIWNNSYPSIDYASDILEGTQTYLVKVKKGDKEIIIPSPVDMISAKISQCLSVLNHMNKAENNQLYRGKNFTYSEEEIIEKNQKTLKHNRDDYNKKLKDLIILMSYTKTIYPNDFIVNRIFEVVKYKHGNFDFMEQLASDIEDLELSNIIKQVIAKTETKEL